MADSYLEFSEVLPCMTAGEEAWLRAQLEIVYVFGEQEYAEGHLPEELAPAEAAWYGCRAWRDLEDYEPDESEPVGFAWEFHDDQGPRGWGRHPGSTRKRMAIPGGWPTWSRSSSAGSGRISAGRSPTP